MAEFFQCLDENEIAAAVEGKATADEVRHIKVCSKCGEALTWLKKAIATTPKNLPIAPYEGLPAGLRHKISRKKYAAMIGGYGRRNLMTGEAAFPRKLSLSDKDDYLCHCGFMLSKTGDYPKYQWPDDEISHVRFFECSECKSNDCAGCVREWMHDGISGLISLGSEI